MARTYNDYPFLAETETAYVHRDMLSIYGDGFWRVNNSDLADYSRRANFLDRPDSLPGIIRSTIGANEENVGLDIAAGTSA